MIDNRDEIARSPAHELALDCVEAGVAAAQPERVVREAIAVDGGQLRIQDRVVDLDGFEEIVVLGGGKAAGGITAALESVLGDRIDGGVVVTTDPVDTDRVAVVEGEHPVPDDGSLTGAKRVLARARVADENSLILAVVSGGGSALLAAPAEGVALSDLQTVTDALLDSGAPIEEINAVRKHCSAIKGGGLARAAAPATVVGLLFSDVVGDDPAVVASGPTAPDPTTFGDALAVLETAGVDPPAAIRERLERGEAGELPETPTAADPAFGRVSNDVLADGWTALDAAREVAEDVGHTPLVLSSRIEGEARDAAMTQAAVAAEAAATGNPVQPPAVVLSGGETTVTVTGDGSGGPNCEFALSAARSLPDGAVLASVDTDGRDGASEGAGGLVDATTVADSREATEALRANDAATFLDARDALIRTGATGTNVNDLRVLVVEDS